MTAHVGPLLSFRVDVLLGHLATNICVFIMGPVNSGWVHFEKYLPLFISFLRTAIFTDKSVSAVINNSD